MKKIHKRLKRFTALFLIIVLLPLSDVQAAVESGKSRNHIVLFDGSEQNNIEETQSTEEDKNFEVVSQTVTQNESDNRQVSENEEEEQVVASDEREYDMLPELEVYGGWGMSYPPSDDDDYHNRTVELYFGIHWERIDDVTSYTIYRDGVFIQTVDQYENNIEDFDVEVKTQYVYRIEAYGINEELVAYGEINVVPIEDVSLQEGEWILEEDIYVNSLNAVNTVINLNGHDLVCLQDISFGQGAELILNGGWMEVKGDFSVEDNAKINMDQWSDYISVDGNVHWENELPEYNVLTAGTLYLLGDFYQKKHASFVAAKTHTVVFAGDARQYVDAPLEGTHFGKIEICNNSLDGVVTSTVLDMDSFTKKEVSSRFVVEGTDEIQCISIAGLSEDLSIEGDAILRADSLSLNGHTLTIKGNLYHEFGYIMMSEGKLIVEGDYRQEIIYGDDSRIYGCAASSQIWFSPSGYVLVKGDFVSASSRDGWPGNTMGTMEVQGNILAKQSDSVHTYFNWPGNHKFIISGEGQHIFRADDSASISNLCLGENTAVLFDGNICVSGSVEDKSASNEGAIIAYSSKAFSDNHYGGSLIVKNSDFFSAEEFTMEGDLIIRGDPTITGTVNVNGNCYIEDGGSIVMSGGTLNVAGDLYCESSDTNNAISMTHENDYILVKGDFYFNAINAEMTDGVLEIKGDVSIENGINASANHILKFSGDRLQTVSIGNENHAATIDVRNYSEEGVLIKKHIRKQLFLENGCHVTYEYLVSQTGWTLTEDSERDFLVLGSGELNLNGYTLTIHTDFILAGGTLNVNGGKLIIKGDFNQQSCWVDEKGNLCYGEGEGILCMQNENDYVRVEQNYYFRTMEQKDGYLSDGLLEIWGDLCQLSEGENGGFCATGNHTLWLNGNNHKMYFSQTGINTDDNKINNLIISGNVTFIGNPYVLGTVEENYIYNMSHNGGIRIGMNTTFINRRFSGDVEVNVSRNIDDDLFISGSMKVTVNLNISSQITIKKDLIFDGQGAVRLDSGKVRVTGNCYELNEGALGFSMTHEDDYLSIYGNYSKSGPACLQMSEGLMEISGDIKIMEGFHTSGTHVISVQGRQLQTIDIGANVSIANFEINNYSSEGVYITQKFSVDHFNRNGCRLEYGDQDTIEGWILRKNTTIEKNIILDGDTLDLNGYTLTIHGNLIQESGRIEINNGHLIVDGDFRQQKRSEVEGDYEGSDGILCMTHANDNVEFNGDCYIGTKKSTYGYYTNGRLSIKGNFQQIKYENNNNFWLTDEHTLILSGKGDQLFVGAGAAINHFTIDARTSGTVTVEGEPFVRGILNGYGVDINGYVRVSTPQLQNNRYSGSLRVMYSWEVRAETTIGKNLSMENAKLYIYNNMTIGGDYYVDSVDVHSGTLKIEGNYYCNLTETSHHSGLFIDGYGIVIILGNFINEASTRRSKKSSGWLYVKGDFITQNYGLYGTMVILDGNKQQTISMGKGDRLSTLEIRNYSKEGVVSENILQVDRLIRNNCNMRYACVEGEFGYTLTEDLVIEGDYVLIEDTLKLNGHNMIVKGDFIHYGGTLCADGNLIIEGNYKAQVPEKYSPAYTWVNMTGSSMGKIDSSKGHLLVNGDFIVDIAQCYTMEGGILEVKGNIDYIQGYFSANSCNTLILSGDKEQRIQLGAEKEIGNLTVQNPDRVIFNRTVIATNKVEDVYGTVDRQNLLKVKLLKQVYSWNGDVEVTTSGENDATGDIMIGGTLTLNYSTDLQGIRLHVNKLYINSSCNINQAQVFCEEEIYIASQGTLIMEDVQGYLFTNGNFIMDSSYSHEGYLTNGVLEIKGNFTQKRAVNFIATENHVTKLSTKKTEKNRNYIQSIYFTNPGSARFHKVILTKTFEGYNFTQQLSQVCDEYEFQLDDEIPPSAVEKLESIEIGLTEIQISYDGATDQHPIVGYNIYRDGELIRTTEKKTFTDTELETDTEYSYTVYAFDEYENVALESPVLTVRTLKDEEAPDKITSFYVATRTGSSITLKWNRPADNVGVESYKLYRDGEFISSMQGTTYKDCGLQENTAYRYTIEAIDKAGNVSPRSAALETYVVMPKITDIQPKDYTLLGGDMIPLKIFFRDSGNSYGNRVKLEYYDAQGVLWDISEEPLGQKKYNDSTLYVSYNWDISQLTEISQYKIVITLYDADDNENVREVCYLVDREAPEAVSGVVAVACNQVVNLSWDVSLSADCENYRVYRRKPGDEKFVLSGTLNGKYINRYADKSVEAGYTYEYVVTALDTFQNESAYSQVVSVLVDEDLEPPQIVNVTPNPGRVHKSVTIQVNAKDNVAVDRLKLEYAKEGENEYSLLWTASTDSGTGTYVWNTESVEDGIYTIRAVAVDKSGNESTKEYFRRYEVDNTGISQIEITKYEAGSSTVALHWKDVPEEDFGYFAIEQKKGDSFARIATTKNQLGYLVTGLKPNMEYQFRVVGYDNLENRGIESDICPITTIEDFIAPTITFVNQSQARCKGNVTLQVKGSDNVGIDKAIFYISEDKKNYTQLATVSATAKNTTETLSYVWNSNEYDEGTYDILFEVYDTAGNKNALLSDGRDVIATYIIDRTAPEKVENVTAMGEFGYVALNWNQSSEADIAGYNIYRAESEQGQYCLLAGNVRTLNYYDTKVEQGKTYYYVLAATDVAQNESEKSEEVYATSKRDTKIPQIQGMLPKSGNSVGANTVLQAVASDNASLQKVIFEYRMRDGEDDIWKSIGEVSASGRSSIVKVTWNTEGLLEGEYELRSYAIDASENTSDIYQINCFLDLTAPSRPDVNVTSKSYSVEIDVSGGNEEDFSHFEIYRREVGNASYTRVTSFGGGSYIDKNVDADKVYYYMVRSFDINGNYTESPLYYSYADTKDTEAPVAVLPENIVGMVGMQIAFDGTASTDNVRVCGFEWNMGDGTTLYGAQPIHTYQQKGIYIVTLTVMDAMGNKSSTTCSVRVLEKTGNGISKVTITDTKGVPIPYALVCVQTGESDSINLKADGSGVVTIAMKEGVYAVAAYKSGYLPTEQMVRISQYEDTSYRIALESGEVVVGNLEVHKMDLEEMIEAGVDFSDPKNYASSTISISLTFAQCPIPVQVEYQNGAFFEYTYEIPEKNGGISGDSGTGKIVIQNIISPATECEEESEKPILAYLHTVQSVAWLKDMYSVNLGILNAADTEFTLEDSRAELVLPKGLSLAATKGEQELVQDMGIIKGQQEKNASWVVKGDTSGTYRIKAQFTGMLQPFQEFISVEFEAIQDITVSMGEGLHLYIMPESTAYIGELYYIQFKLVNESLRTFYNLGTSFGSYKEPTYVQKYILKIQDSTVEGGWRYETIRQEELQPLTFRISSTRKKKRIPTLATGQNMEISLFEPGDEIYGTFVQCFEAEGDPNEVYYELINMVAQDLKGSGMEVTISEGGSHVSATSYMEREIPVTYGDPIDVSTGAFTEEIPIITFGDNSGLGLQLSYNSKTTRESGECGYGWHHNWEGKLEDDNGIICVYPTPETEWIFVSKELSDGVIYGQKSEDSIILNEDAPYYGIYQPVTSGIEKYQVEKMMDGTYKMIYPDHSISFFDHDGKLIALQDPYGYDTTLVRDGNIVTITDEITGQKLILSYNEKGLLTQVADENGRSSLITYEDGMLSSIIDVLGQEKTFTYSDRKLTTATGNDGVTYVSNTYDEYGRVIMQQDGRQDTQASTMTYVDTDSGTYMTICDHNGNTTSMEMDKQGNILSKTTPDGGTITYTYDRNNHLVSEKDPYQNMVAYEYDEQGNMTAIYDPYSNATKMYYDRNGNMTSLCGMDGSTVTYEYDSFGKVVKETDAAGKITHYEYDNHGKLIHKSIEGLGSENYVYEAGNLTASTDRNGNTRYFTYDNCGNPTSITDEEGNTIQYTYDALGQMVKAEYGDGSSIYFTYDCNGNVISMKDQAQNVTTYLYDANGLKIREVLPNGGVEQYFYDGEGNNTKIIFADGTEETAEYDGVGRLIKRTLPTGGTYSYTYDLRGLITKGTDPDGVEITYEYYNNGNIYKETYSDGRSRLYTYDSMWRLISVTDAENHSTSYEYDVHGNVHKTRDALGNTQTDTYDIYNRLVAQTDAKGNTTRYEYDANGNCIMKENAEGHRTYLSYDKTGRLVTISTRNGEEEIQVSYTYDVRGNCIQYTDEEGSVTDYSYDTMGNLIHQTDPMGYITTYTYDSMGRVVSSIDALGNESVYTYDQVGRILSTTLNSDTLVEQEWKCSYDDLGRLINTVDPLNGESGYTYSAAGRVYSMTDPNGGTTTYTYDSAGRLVAQTDAIGLKTSYFYNDLGLLQNTKKNSGKTTSYVYDEIGRVVSMKDDLGEVCYTYDENGNVLSVEDGNGTISRTYDVMNRVTSYTDYKGDTIRYGYDELGNRISLTYPGGEIVRYEYYKNGQLKTVTDWNNCVTSYEYDKNGNLIKTTNCNGTVEEKTYDALGQITTRNLSKGEEILDRTEYTYDASGNITGISQSEGLEADILETVNTVMTYDEANRLLTYNGEEIQYDEDGNMIYGPLNGAMAEFLYDCRNRLIQTKETDGAVTSYEYDAENNRIAVENGMYREEYCLDVESTYSQMLTAKRSSKGGSEKEYTLSLYVYGNGLIGERSKEVKENGTTEKYDIYYFNHLGSTTAILDTEGNIIERYGYGAYGELVTKKYHDRRFLYNGQMGVVTDANGLYYMRSRYYNTSIKRFMNQDILFGDITNSQSLNRYSYVQGNPVKYTDPFGLSPEGGWGETGHLLLQTLGFVPGFGIVADVTNAIWYYKEGRYFESFASLLSAIPGIGDAVGMGLKAVSTGCKALKLADTISTTAHLIGSAASMTLAMGEMGSSTYGIYQSLTDENYAGNVWENLTNLGLATINAVLSGKSMSMVAGKLSDIRTGTVHTSGCFIAGTLIETKDGKKNIEDIKEGDYVTSRDPVTGDQTEKKVLTLYRYEKYILIHVYTEQEEIVTTKEHPFYVEGAGFVTAESLKVGDVLRTTEGEDIKIIKVDAEYLSIPVTVYNFEVEDYHTYYVGEAGIYVHNMCGVAKDSTKTYRSSESGSGSSYGNYTFKDGIDVDLRGKGNYQDALNDAFNKTGVSKEDFNVTKWGRDKNGKSFPVEWRANNGAEVSIDLGHSPYGEAPTVPHVGWQTGGKRGNGGALRGHIFVDDVPYNR